MGRFLDRAKAAAEQAAAKAKEGVDEVQTKRELSQAYNDLGKTAYELAASGEIAHTRLEGDVEKIRALNEKLGGGTEPEPTVEPFDSSQPPPMPT